MAGMSRGARTSTRGVRPVLAMALLALGVVAPAAAAQDSGGMPSASTPVGALRLADAIVPLGPTRPPAIGDCPTGYIAALVQDVVVDLAGVRAMFEAAPPGSGVAVVVDLPGGGSLSFLADLVTTYFLDANGDVIGSSLVPGAPAPVGTVSTALGWSGRTFTAAGASDTSATFTVADDSMLGGVNGPSGSYGLEPGGADHRWYLIGTSLALPDGPSEGDGSTDPVVVAPSLTERAVMQQYRDLFGREADPEGLAFWSDRLCRAAQTFPGVVATLYSYPEAEGYGTEVARLYFAYFGRVPDFGGLLYWIGERRAGRPLADVSYDFFASDEFQALRSTVPTDGQFVDDAYRRVLERPSDPGGRSWWIAQLGAGLSRWDMVTTFSESPEGRSVKFGDVNTSVLYGYLVRRAPDPGGFEYWEGRLEPDAVNAARAGLIGALLDSDEYAARFP